MSLTSRYIRPEQTGSISCSKYQAIPGSKRCIHYQDGGVCMLPEEFVCSEWHKANAGRIPKADRDASTSLPAELPPPAKDLLGHPLPPARPKRETAKEGSSPLRPIPQPPAEAPVLIRGLTDADIAGFKALQLEICLENDDIGEVWLVPDYTGQARKELSCNDAAFLAAVCATFPGAKVTSFAHLKPTSDERRTK